MKSIYTKLFLIVVLVLSYSGLKSENSVEAIIIEQPKDVIECVGSLDQYLFVVAAPSDRQYKIAYRWLKDERPITQWVEDFGKLTFDTLKFSMSGVYYAEIFAFDPNWTSLYGNPFNYDSARVSPIVKSDRVNLYVLQPPSFMKNIETQTVKRGEDCVFTFDAHIYHKHNMKDPTYWTYIQWFKGSVKLVDDDRISGSQSSILTIHNINKSDYSTKYRVRLIGECDTIWSNEFAIDPGPYIVLKKYGMLNVYTWCTNKRASVGFNVGTIPPNLPMEYQWYMNDKPIENKPNKYVMTYKPIPSQDYSELTITAFWNSDFENEEFQKYRVEIWPKGYEDNIFSKEFMRFVWVKPLELTTDLEDEYTVVEGQEIVFDPGITGYALRYWWMKDGIETPVSDSIYRWKAARLEDSGIYYLEAINDCGKIRTKNAKLTVIPKQAIAGIEDNFTNQEISIYPNPLTSNSTLTIRPLFSGKVSVIVADVLGNKLATLYNDMIQAGRQKSINLNIHNIGLSSGTYFIIIQMGDKVQTKQISVVR
ncbi:T9SS type A sorting domain-containing protein [bacterium]|nr:MAG: T9SS type A sorting domain-containing protein [bacterium]